MNEKERARLLADLRDSARRTEWMWRTDGRAARVAAMVERALVAEDPVRWDYLKAQVEFIYRDIAERTPEFRTWLRRTHPEIAEFVGYAPIVPDDDGTTPETQDWHEDVLVELARVLGVDPAGLSKGQLHAAVDARLAGRDATAVTHSDGSRAVLVDGVRVTAEKGSRGEKAYKDRMATAEAIVLLRGTLYEAPGFLPLVDRRRALDGRPCGVPHGAVPCVDPSTWRADPEQIRWNLAQHLCLAADWLAWPVARYVYVAERAREDPIDSATPKALAAHDANGSHRVFGRDVAAHLERVGADAVSQYFSSPAGDAVAVVSDLPPSRFVGEELAPVRPGALAWRKVGAAIRPAADTADARRMVVELVDRVMSVFPRDQAYQYWEEVLHKFRESRFHFVVPRGMALEERVHVEKVELPAGPCIRAHLHAPEESPAVLLGPAKFVRRLPGATLEEQVAACTERAITALEARCRPYLELLDRPPTVPR